MPKIETLFVCQTCGAGQPRWAGRCPACGAWNSFVEEVVRKAKGLTAGRGSEGTAKTVNLCQVAGLATARRSTGITELDLVLGGGLVPGQVSLLAGEPGIGKSTLLLQVAEAVGSGQLSVFSSQSSDSSLSVVSPPVDQTDKQKTGQLKSENRKPITANRVLYISGEESPEQIKIRADRLGLGSSPSNGAAAESDSAAAKIEILPETDVDLILSHLSALSDLSHLSLIIVDSIQTLTTADLASASGSVGQVKECAARLASFAKKTNTPLILVGHVTKDGAIAGPKVLEHLVDTVLYLEGERYHDLRLLRAVKNRFGSPETGVFRLTDKGMEEVKDPAGLFAANFLNDPRPGAVSTVVMEGARPLLLEVQALATRTATPYPRRAATGFSLGRLLMLLAVLEKYGHVSLSDKDVYVNVVGGFKIFEPAADLAILLAVAGSLKEKALPKGLIVFGEVGLSGEIRAVSFAERREREAKKLGLTELISPETVRSVNEALNRLGLSRSD